MEGSKREGATGLAISQDVHEGGFAGSCDTHEGCQLVGPESSADSPQKLQLLLSSLACHCLWTVCLLGWQIDVVTADTLPQLLPQ